MWQLHPGDKPNIDDRTDVLMFSFRDGCYKITTLDQRCWYKIAGEVTKGDSRLCGYINDSEYYDWKVQTINDDRLIYLRNLFT